ncbi:unnamed protein product [Linum trigynum]|uniref:Secreted protein n=1 Tax=Linum trigynum TaxID=586398 RepID=A0AAV2DXM8_9ROSI
MPSNRPLSLWFVPWVFGIQKPSSPPLWFGIWLKTRKSRLTRAGPHGRVAYPVARVRQNAPYHLVEFQASHTARVARPCVTSICPCLLSAKLARPSHSFTRPCVLSGQAVFALAQSHTARNMSCTAV